jgi:hypothetical protein
MSLIKLNWRPNKTEIRKFGVIFLVGCGILGLAKYLAPFGLWHCNEQFGVILMFAGLFIGGVAIAIPRAALPFYWVWLSIAFVMGNIMSRVLIVAMYFLIITPVGFLSRIVGRDKLQLKRRSVGSYWHPIHLPKDIETYERQF